MESYKICTMCKKSLPLVDDVFASRIDKKNIDKKIFQSNCRLCQKEYRKKHYEQNKQKYIDKARLHTKKISDWFLDIRKSLTCSKCSETRWWVLDFHHTEPSKKEYNLSDLRNMGSKIKLKKELEKCVVLCSNCHRDFHYQEKQAL